MRLSLNSVRRVAGEAVEGTPWRVLGVIPNRDSDYAEIVAMSADPQSHDHLLVGVSRETSEEQLALAVRRKLV